MVSGAYFINSTGIPSYPGLLSAFTLAITFWISSAVKRIAISVGGKALIACLFLQKVLKKYSVTIYFALLDGQSDRIFLLLTVFGKVLGV